MVDDGAHHLLRHGAICVEIFVAGAAFIERRVDVGDLAARDDRQHAVAGRTGLHRNQHVDFFLEDQRVCGFLSAGRTRAVIGNLDLHLLAENAASCIDFVGGQLGRLHDGRRHHAVGPGKPGWYSDFYDVLSFRSQARQ